MKRGLAIVLSLLRVTILLLTLSPQFYNAASAASKSFDPEYVPPYTGWPYSIINENEPFFLESELTTYPFESYSELDSLGRCGIAYVNVCRDLMPTEPRGAIGNVRPSGWKQEKYEGLVDSSPPYLYNRCHLVGYQLSGENSNEKNLITGTRYLNIQGMLQFENRVANYVESSGGHVLYRVTPVFIGENLLASGVLIEAQSVENPYGIRFCVFCYNVQPGVAIDYSDGSSRRK